MLLRTALVLGLACITSAAFAQVQVRGYTKKDGTYVQPYVRSNPNSTKSDNYGPSRRSRSSSASSYSPSYVSPYSRDKDNDGVSNQNDIDDDNDGLWDDYDENP